ncbi:MAG: YbaN family protein [Aquabacterium sp.]
MIEHTKMLLWRTLALFGLALAVIGLLLPVMPTVPFLLVAAWAASKGWPELEARLLSHPLYGPPIRDWRNHGAVPRKVKWFASFMMSCSATMLWFVPIPDLLRWGIYATFLIVGGWLWMRPEPPPQTTGTSATSADVV